MSRDDTTITDRQTRQTVAITLLVNGWSQRQVAKHLGLASATITNWVRRDETFIHRLQVARDSAHSELRDMAPGTLKLALETLVELLHNGSENARLKAALGILHAHAKTGETKRDVDAMSLDEIEAELDRYHAERAAVRHKLITGDHTILGDEDDEDTDRVVDLDHSKTDPTQGVGEGGNRGERDIPFPREKIARDVSPDEDLSLGSRSSADGSRTRDVPVMDPDAYMEAISTDHEERLKIVNARMEGEEVEKEGDWEECYGLDMLPDGEDEEE